MIEDALAAAIREKKEQLDANRPLWGAALEGLRHYYDVELTYTSNAIEGNTLSHSETALVIEKGITVGGKLLEEHLEAQDLYAAVGYMRGLASAGRAIGESDVVELHRRVVLRSKPAIAGVYSRLPRRIAGSAVVFPNPAKIPDLMAGLGAWLEASGNDYETALEAHLRLVAIHPFADGNGRTARLLMNLMLIRGGYPPVAVRLDDRKAYIDAIEHAQLSGDKDAFAGLLARRLDATLADYVAACSEANQP